MKDIIFITFDMKKDEYPSMSYSIAVLMAVVKQAGKKAAHYSVDVRNAMEEKDISETITDVVTRKLCDNLSYFKKFRFIAVGLTAWSIEYCRDLTEMLSGYTGKVILGGYEVTAWKEELLATHFPRVDYFVKGYSEDVLMNLRLPKNSPYIKYWQGGMCWMYSYRPTSQAFYRSIP